MDFNIFQINYKRFLFFSFIILLSLYSVRVLIPLSDYAMITFVIFSLFKFRRIYYDKLIILYGVWFVLSFLSILIVGNEIYFNYDKFILSSARNFLAILSMSFLPLWLMSRIDKINIACAVVWFLLLCPIIQLLFFIMVNVDYHGFLNIVAHGEQSNRQEWLNVYDYSLYMRYGGLFEEPSWYAWFNIYLFGILISFEKHCKVNFINWWHILLISIGFLLTFSIAGIISFSILCFCKINAKSTRIFFCFVFLTLILTLFFVFYDSPFVLRALAIVNGADGSANTRIFGSYNRAVIILSNLPMGAGFGNTTEAIKQYFFNGQSSGVISNQNGFVEVYLSTGFLLGSLYMLPLFLMFFINKYRVIFITIFLVYFTASSIFISPMWIFLGLSIYILHSSKSKQIA